MARVAAGRTLERPRRRLRVTTLVRAPPSGVRVRAVHAENGGIRRRNLQMAAGVPWADGAPTRHTQRRRPYPARFRSVMVQGTPGSPWYRPNVPLVAVSGVFNCPQAPREGQGDVAWAIPLLTTYPLFRFSPPRTIERRVPPKPKIEISCQISISVQAISAAIENSLKP